MAILKKQELRQKSTEELKKIIYDLKFELLKERGKIQIGSPPENPGKISQTRKTIARINTYLNEKKINE
ncbi:MAG: 50S ribosomal protein L29 [Candidatus Aenigmarchaeota archaeon ex4484_52]|nr:MAG: 50S ribosomal protein L29 [Candidatus Aenigmarchaeota archaeon ex4484_52]